ncbi:hypothetical protein I4U23_018286 [Adineta vaga]|nr:hypothetical protein I4U23_018286 [Adineta vaga]
MFPGYGSARNLPEITPFRGIPVGIVGKRLELMVIQDAVKLREMGSAISWDDEMFSMEQEAIMNVVIDQVVKHLEEAKCELGALPRFLSSMHDKNFGGCIEESNQIGLNIERQGTDVQVA